MKKALLGILIPLLITGCQYSKSVKKDLVTGLSSKGDGLACEDIYLSVNDEKVNRNTFLYGEKIYVNFDDISGFKKEGDKAFPAMDIFITGKNGDTVFKAEDLYAEYDGISFTPLLLSANIIAADPMHSNSAYTLNINISDKKGEGTYTATFPFNITPNEKLIINPQGISYNEIYLFEESTGKVITDNTIGYDQNIYLILEGIEGLNKENGVVFPGLSLKISDHSGNTIVNIENLFADYSETGYDASEVQKRISAQFNITGSGAENPIHCVAFLWDLKGDSKLTVETELTIK